MGDGTAREIDLGKSFGDVVVKVNGARLEIRSDGSVDAYTNGNVKVHAAANNTHPKATHEIGDIERGGVELQPAANDDANAGVKTASIEIGAVERNGKHKGEIYGGIYPADNKPIWFSVAARLMDHYSSAAWAKSEGGSLPTRKQGDYLTTLRGKGCALTKLFTRGSSFPAGYVWLAEPFAYTSINAWCQRLSDGGQYKGDRDVRLPVLCVRR